MSNKRQLEIRAYQQLSGLNYTGAGRELDRCADPRPADVARQATQLLGNIETVLPSPGSDTKATETERALALSTNELRSIVSSADARTIYWDEYDAAIRVTEWLADADESGVSLSADAAIALVDTIRAVRRKTCQLGHNRTTPCSTAPQRALLNLADKQRQGCFQHIAESILQQQHAEHPMYFSLNAPLPVIEVIQHLASGGTVSLPEEIDLETEWGDALASLAGLELEYDLAQHTDECAQEAIATAYALGHDDPHGIEQVAAQVLKDSPQTCICHTSENS
ncbi:hypothetical protein PWY87_10175 [Kribbella solani]|uniref:hypothetical protein n=1 Tax=Kribbella solani TaxID=236067 RepID=UPI0029A4785C|nr:hypothetical protein [Kribbella solani]MDX3002036.1 hypothetical protein [Kribbella solani]